MQTLPKPLPDELLYSTLARATYRYGFWSPKRLLDILYGRRTVVAVPDLPTNLASLTQSTENHWQLGVEELAVHHTLFGYYTHFRGARQRKKVLAAMAADGGSLQVRLGVCAGAARTPKRFRLCLRCHGADVAQFGEAYWHRAHHLPGVLVCHLHGEPLLESDVPFRPRGRHVYLAAPLEGDLHSLPPLVSNLTRPKVAWTVAVRSFELLASQPRTVATRPDYRPRLGQWGAGWGRAKRFRNVFVEYFGEDLLLASFGREDGDPLAWLEEVLRGPRRPLHPFKHVLMEVFLDGREKMLQDDSDPQCQKSGKSWGVYRLPEMRKEAVILSQLGLSTHAVAWTLDVDWKTATRLLAPLPSPQPKLPYDPDIDRRAWEMTAAAHSELGKKALRNIAPALYARLYRNDRAWLIAWKAKCDKRPAVARRIDWPQRDLALELRVRQQVAQTLKESPPCRASRSHVLGMLGLRALLAHRATLLPRTSTALDALCETVEAYQLRRLELVFRQEGGHSIPDWKALRDARIQPGRLPDGGQGLIQRARRRANEVASGEFAPEATP
jgi:hypothetical protein